MQAIPEFAASTGLQRIGGQARRTRVPAKQTLQVRAATTYDAASHTRRTAKWHAPTVDPNSLLSNLTTLRDRSRAADRNDGVATAIIDTLVSNIIGDGILPLSQATDPTFRAALHARWRRWTDESDADGLLPFEGQQAQACRTWLVGGDCFARLRPRLPKDGLSVPFQVQVVEPELCPHTYTVTRPNGNRVRAGIEFDGIGRRVGYWFHRSRPGDLLDYDRSQLVFLPADAVIHLYSPRRPGQLRGLPRLTQALIKLYELDKYDDAVLYRQELGNMFLGFIRRPATTGEEAAIHPLTGQVITGTDVPTLTFEPGTLQELEPGEEMQFSEPPDVGSNYADFMRAQLSIACNSAGVPYEVVTGDMRGLNDRTMRVIVNEFRRQIQAAQHQIFAHQFCRRVFRAWLDRAFFAEALPIPLTYLDDPSPWAAVKWMPPKWQYLHPVQDVQAQKEAIRNGFTSRQSVVAENGEDAEAIDAEQQADNARADALGLRYDSDGRQAQASTRRETAEPIEPIEPVTEGAPA